MRALEHAARIEAAYKDVAKSEQFQQDAQAVREALIRAVRAVHPDVQFEIPKDQVENCSDFLSKFKKVFTLNYDSELTPLHFASGGQETHRRLWHRPRS